MIAARAVPVFDRLLSLQTPRGAFPSTVTAGPDKAPIIDETAFITAQIVIILSELSGALDAERCARALDSCERALDFLETCESRSRRGAFHFYSRLAEARRLPIALPPDADDTALCWAAFVIAGRRRAGTAASALRRCLEPLPAAARQSGDAPWVGAGAVRTWLAMGGENPVDVAVNANIAFACAVCGLTGRLRDGAVATAVRGLAGSGTDPAHLRRASPYYRDPAEIACILHRASRAGIMRLRRISDRFSACEAADRLAGRPVERPLYCNAHGEPVWRSAALQLARRFEDMRLRPHPKTSSQPEGDCHDDAKIRA
mgnify:CR=1 FL=1